MKPDTSPSTGSGAGGLSTPHPSKRARHASPDHGNSSPRTAEESTGNADDMSIDTSVGILNSGSGNEPGSAKEGKGGGKAGQSSNFRNRLPSCKSCEKANMKCVGYDPITKREIPRSYVYYLETRINYLENLLLENSIPFSPAEILDQASRPGPDPNAVQTPSDDGRTSYSGSDFPLTHKQPQEVAWNKKQDESEKLNKLVSNIGNVSVQGASDARYLGSTSGISFARVVFAAVKSSVSGTNSEKSGVRPSKPDAAKAVGTGTSMRDSFFGLHTKPTIKQAPFPDKEVGKRLVELYFEHANPQIPILHRGEFMKMFELAYVEGEGRVRTPKELYMLNIVFAIGSGIFLGDSERDGEEKSPEKSRKRFTGKQGQPEEYHASAIVHLESCLSSPSSIDGFGGGLEELQAVLLLAGFALLRPVAPGLWYIIGVAVRLAVDLGLHYEDGKDIDVGLEEVSEDVKREDSDLAQLQRERSARERGRREWIRDFRRRLWWCTYSFDRLVSTCVGRPFGVTDEVVTTEFPSLLDDKYISPAGFQEPPGGDSEPSYKHAAYHYFRLRLLQSEILQVLQHQLAQQARAGGLNQRNSYMHIQLPSSFLSKFDSFRSWRIDIDKRLWEWKSSAPTKQETGVAFSVEFLELNYWQCIIMLYRQSLSVPPVFEGEFSTTEEVDSPSMHNVELREDEERVFLKVAEAGQRVLRLYRQLHRVHLVNYTFLATHHLFMAGISFLYAIWHSPIVRSRLTMDEVDFTILAATSVLGDLIEKCPPAEACRDAFDRMSKATVQMCMSTTGFSSSAQGLNSRRKASHHTHPNDSNGGDYFNKTTSISRRQANRGPTSNSNPGSTAGRPKPTFDMGLDNLFSNMPPQSVQRNTPSTTVAIKSELEPYASNLPTSPTTYNTLSPPLSALDNSSIDPSLLPSPQGYSQQPQNFTYPTSAQNPAPNIPFFPMDFTFDNLDENSGLGNATGDFGMGLGVGLDGLDLDFNHDFSEGGNGGLDFFDGFFFGGAGGN
ncbi:hypothetical protein B7494_g5831 [Chlorociboria aeruginascens]|nr:hypothetical protein B7494_g5831 [Chlorociboria aeruginascens]